MPDWKLRDLEVDKTRHALRFLRWSDDNRGRFKGDFECFLAWTREIWRSPLNDAAKSILWTEIKRAMREHVELPPDEPVPERREGESAGDYLERIAEGLKSKKGTTGVLPFRRG